MRRIRPAPSLLPMMSGPGEGAWSWSVCGPGASPASSADLTGGSGVGQRPGSIRSGLEPGHQVAPEPGLVDRGDPLDGPLGLLQLEAQVVAEPGAGLRLGLGQPEEVGGRHLV